MELKSVICAWGETVDYKKGDILFDINKLRNKRTMVFAQSGFGKTNLIKVLLYNMIGDTSYGKLIFDLNGELFLERNKYIRDWGHSRKRSQR